VAEVASKSILEKFHSDVRLNATAEPGYRVVRESPVVRLVSDSKKTPFNLILLSDLDESNADAIIEREIAYFRKANEPFEWKLFSYDSPKNLAESLVLHGLREADEEALMVASLEDLITDAKRSPELTIRKIENEKELAIALRTVNEDETNPEHLEALLKNLLIHLGEAKDTIGIFGGYFKGEPVCLGWAFYPPHSRFCGLFGGTTLSSQRGKGYYRALVHARAAEARKKGFKYLFVDAGPQSQPILTRAGFSEIAKIRGYHWSPY